MSKNIISYITLIVIIFLLIAYGYAYKNKYDNAKQKSIHLEKVINNINDSVEVKVNRIGELQYQQAMIEADLSTIKSLNDSLYDKVKNISGARLKDVKSIVELKTKINLLVEENMLISSVKKDSLMSDSSYIYKFNYKTAHRILDGNITFTSKQEPDNFKFNVNRDEIDMDIYITEADGLLIAKSNIPGFSVNTINAYKIPVKPKRKKKFSLAVFTGPGISMPISPSNSKFDVSWSVGVGLSYDILDLF